MAAPHLLAGPATPSPDPAGDWLPLSAALTAQIPAIAGRDDLVVACAPGAGVSVLGADKPGAVSGAGSGSGSGRWMWP